MTGFIRWILGFVVATACVLFALGNRMLVFISWSPFHDATAMPLFLPALVALAIGFILGGAMVWLYGADQRRVEKRQRKLIRNLEKKLEDSEKESGSTDLALMEEQL